MGELTDGQMYSPSLRLLTRGRFLQIATDMGGDKAPRKVDAGVRDILKIVDDLKPEDSGSYINYTGERLPF